MSGSRLNAQSKGRAKLCIRWNVEFPDESGQQDAASSPRAMAPMGKKESTRDPADQGQGWRGRLGCHRHTRDTSSTTPPCPPQITTLRNPRIHLTRTHSDTVLYTLVALSRSRVPPRRASMRSRSSNTLFHDPIWEDL
ncbi:hypothetical protein CTAM01_07628 [Colletotrichum tamarilloi]|uniref:Uncharacterized protein n=1 Tax=Colletotrichum tamarilloi TaxID=1209934 RepID=A0ABQ9R8D6_9PEZI|nr:uncharacterized protein CTAM01_07628 [Colletotrichum tamarilloi]KAK1497991.1 hypothetical protein CTAM01_07628 [Colletotrichum tamarilloi]